MIWHHMHQDLGPNFSLDANEALIWTKSQIAFYLGLYQVGLSFPWSVFLNYIMELDPYPMTYKLLALANRFDPIKP